MTPAKLLALMGKRLDYVELRERTVVQIAYMYACAHRDPGDESKGRPPGPEIPLSDFLTPRQRRRKSLGPKGEVSKPGGEHNLSGAAADRTAWESFVAAKKKQGKSTNRKA